MKRMLSLEKRIATIVILLIGASSVAQEAQPNKVPSLKASLLLIKADWSQAPAVKEIEADLREVLSGETVAKELLDQLPGSGPSILFPDSAVSIFTKEHYAQLLAWLTTKQLIQNAEPFEPNMQRDSPGALVSTATWATLNKEYEFFGLSSSESGGAPRPEHDLFFTRSTQFRWMAWDKTVVRELNRFEKARGQQEAQPLDSGAFDRSSFDFTPLEDGQVMIVQAFPDPSGDNQYREASYAKGFMPVIVVEKGPAGAALATKSRLLLPDKVERIKVQRSWGSNSGFGVPRAGKGAAGTTARLVISKNVMINWSEAKDTAWGFSKSLGKWAEQKLDPPATNPAAPIVGDDLAVWRVGSTYYGFSGEKAQWDVLQLPEGHTPPPVVDSGFVRIHDGDDLFTFSATTGRWSSPTGSSSATESTDPKPATANWDLELKKREVEGSYNAARENLAVIIQQLTTATGTDRPRLETEEAKLRPQVKSLAEQLELINQRLANPAANPPAAPAMPGLPGAAAAPVREGNPTAPGGAPDESQIKIFTLRNLLATDAERTITQLFARDVHSIAADERTNSLIVRGPAAELNIIYHILTRLDEPAESASASQSTAASGWSKAATAASLENLTKQYQAKDRQAANLAQQIRDLQTAPKEHESAIKDLSDKLRRAVTEAFAARQLLHQAEAAQLQQRTAGIQQTLQTRDRLNKEIIDKRVKDLLNPDLRWDAAESVSTKPAGSGWPSSKTSTSGPERPKSTSRIWWGPETDELLAALRVEVQKLTRDDAPEPRYEGALKITAINSDRLASSDRWGTRLAVGDIILGIQSTGVARPNTRRITLNVVRGSEHFSVSVELPAAKPAAGNWSIDDSAVRAIRDKQRERWTQVEKLYELGRMPVMDTLQAAKDLNDAEVAAASSQKENRDARQASLDRLKQIKSIVDAKVAEGAEPEFHKLTVDAEVLKAEAELAANEQQPMVPRRAAGEERPAAAKAEGQPGLAATRAYRDVLRQRVELLRRGYQAGEFPYSDFMRAMIELDDAEITVAATAQERQAARKAKLDHLKEATAAIERGVKSGEVSQTDLLGVQAELLKAEAELAANQEQPPVTRAIAEDSGKAAKTSAQREWEATAASLPSAAANIVLSGGQSITLRRPDEFREELSSRVRRLEQLKTEDPKKFAGDTATVKKQLEEAIQRDQRELDFLREQYAAQIRLLELEVNDAASAVEVAQNAELNARKLHDAGAIPSRQFGETTRALEAAKLRLERANTLLELYRKADPKKTEAPTAAPDSEGAAAASASKFKERAELFARLHDDPQWIENANHDFKLATTAEERKSAREVKLSWVRDIVKALLRLRQLGEQVDAELTAAEAEVKKAEAELAAESSAGTAAAPTEAPTTKSRPPR